MPTTSATSPPIPSTDKWPSLDTLPDKPIPSVWAPSPMVIVGVIFFGASGEPVADCWEGIQYFQHQLHLFCDVGGQNWLLSLRKSQDWLFLEAITFHYPTDGPPTIAASTEILVTMIQIFCHFGRVNLYRSVFDEMQIDDKDRKALVYRTAMDFYHQRTICFSDIEKDKAELLAQSYSCAMARIIARLFSHRKCRGSPLEATAVETSLYLWCKLMELYHKIQSFDNNIAPSRGPSKQPGESQTQPELHGNPDTRRPLARLVGKVDALTLGGSTIPPESNTTNTTTTRTATIQPTIPPSVPATLITILNDNRAHLRLVRIADIKTYTLSDMALDLQTRWREAGKLSRTINAGPLTPHGSLHLDVFRPGFGMRKSIQLRVDCEEDWEDFREWWILRDEKPRRECGKQRDGRLCIGVFVYDLTWFSVD